MKYIITTTGAVRLSSSGYHADMAHDNERVAAAGRCRIKDGRVEVYGDSVGFGIKAQPQDAQIIERALDLFA